MPRGEFGWNAGAWFGGQLGGTLWILVSTFFLFRRDARLSLELLALFVALNLIGLAAWSLRRRLPAYPAYQTMLLVLGLAGAVAVYVIDRAGLWQSLGYGPSLPARQTYVLLAVTVGAVMLTLHFGRRAS